MNTYEQMREALVKFVRAYEQTDEMAIIKDMAEAYDLSHTALSALPRNCEVGSAEKREQRFETFCSLHHLPNSKGCYSCPAIPTRSPYAFHRDACRANWDQMPYEEGKPMEINNMKAMREALGKIRDSLLNGKELLPAQVVNICNTALAAPPRNCDVGTVEEQAKR